MALIGILFVFVLILSLKSLREVGYVGVNLDTTSTINVDGTGSAFSVPDIATFSFSVNENAKTVAEAQTKATTKMNLALKLVREQGIADKDISTQSYNISPHYEYQSANCPRVSETSSVTYCPSGKSVLTGYDVSQSILVKVRDLTKAGDIFSKIGSAGVQNLNGLDFSVDQPEKIQAEAREKAISAAKSKADKLAKQLGVKLVRVISFSENNGSYARPMYMTAKAMGGDMVSAAAPEIPTGEQKITSTVSITYEIQ